MCEYDQCAATLNELLDYKAHNDLQKVTRCTTLLQVNNTLNFQKQLHFNFVQHCIDNRRTPKIWLCEHHIQLCSTTFQFRVTLCSTPLFQILQIWLCEHLRLVKLGRKTKSKRQSTLDQSVIPRFVQWDLVKLNRILQNKELLELEPWGVTTQLDHKFKLYSEVDKVRNFSLKK